MTKQRFISEYQSLTASEQIHFLSFLAAQLTMLGRGTYETGTDGVAEPERLREINEFQHRVTEQLLDLLRAGIQHMPDNVFADLLVEFANAVGAVGITIKAMEWAKRSLPAAVVPAAH